MKRDTEHTVPTSLKVNNEAFRERYEQRLEQAAESARDLPPLRHTLHQVYKENGIQGTIWPWMKEGIPRKKAR